MIDADDRTIVSDGPNPKWMLGLNLTAEWKGIDFGMLLQASLGAKRYRQSTAYNTPHRALRLPAQQGSVRRSLV